MIDWKKFKAAVARLEKNPLAELPTELTLCKDVDGFCSKSNLKIIHTAMQCAHESAVYCEMGVFQGLSALAALSGSHDDQRLVLVDDFRELKGYGKSKDAPGLKLVRDDKRVLFYEQDCFQVMRNYMGPKWDVWYYDAGHSFAETYAALAMGRHHLADEAIVFVDDTNWNGPRTGVELAILDFGYEKLFDLGTPCNGHWTFWNGWIVLKWKAPNE